MWSAVAVIGRFTLVEALRSRWVGLHLALLLTAFALSEFVGSVAITESAAVRVALLAALLRICVVVTVVLFAAGSLARDWQDKGVQLLLALPCPRLAYFAGRFFGLLAVAGLSAAILSTVLLLHAPVPAVLLWLISLVCELAMVVTFTLLVATTWQQSTGIALSTLGFYALARNMAAIQLIGHGSLQKPGSLGQQSLGVVIDGLAYLLPALDRYSLTEWLVYPGTVAGAALAPIIVQSIIYLSLLGMTGLYDLYRKEV